MFRDPGGQNIDPVAHVAAEVIVIALSHLAVAAVIDHYQCAAQDRRVGRDEGQHVFTGFEQRSVLRRQRTVRIFQPI